MTNGSDDFLDDLDLIIKMLEDYLGITKEIKSKKEGIERVITASKQEDLLMSNTSEIFSRLKKLNRYFNNLRALSMWVKSK